MQLFSPANTASIIYRMLWLFGKNVSRIQLDKEIQIHPDYPHLSAVSDIIRYFGLNNAAYKVSNEDLVDLPLPLIAHTRKQGSEYVLVTSLNRKEVTFRDNEKIKKITPEEFFKLFDGIVLLADSRPSTVRLLLRVGEFFRNHYYFIILTLLLSLGFTGSVILTDIFDTANRAILGLLTCKILGMAVVTLLLAQSLNNNNPLVNKICSGKKSDCSRILNSDAAKIFGGLTWSDIGCFYFAGTSSTLLTCGNSSFGLQTLAILNAIALPYTFYSIFYQWKVAKQWCILCCLVQLTLWLESLFFLPFWEKHFFILHKRS